jgi:hypothetical protein
LIELNCKGSVALREIATAINAMKAVLSSIAINPYIVTENNTIKRPTKAAAALLPRFNSECNCSSVLLFKVVFFIC